MKILHLTTFLQGGAGRIIVDLAVEQRRAGHDVAVVASKTGTTGYGNYPAYLEELARGDVAVTLVDSMFSREHSANLAVVRALNELYPAGAEPAVIHGHAAVPGLVALLFAGARRARIALIQTMHGWGVSKTAEQSAADLSVLNLTDCVAVPSADSATLLASLGVSTNRICVVPYGVSPRQADPDERDLEVMAFMERRRQTGTLVVACVGTVGPRKNQALLVGAIARLKRTPILGVFVGDGDTAGLKDAAVQAGVIGHVRIHGYSAAARSIAAAADVLVLPSRSEGQPISVLEAFCDRTLVAVSDIPELVELVTDGVDGFRFQSDRPDSLAYVLRSMASLPLATRDAIRDRAHARFATQFTTSAMTGAYDALYATGVATMSRSHSTATAA